jgi:hypothetical protein
MPCCTCAGTTVLSAWWRRVKRLQLGRAWAQSDAVLCDVIGVVLAPPSASRRFRVVSMSSRDVIGSVHVADAQPLSRKVLLSDVAAAALGTVFDYLRTGNDAHALRTTCRRLTTAFDAAIDNESPTMNGIALKETKEDTWRWCPLFRIPPDAYRTRAPKAYMTRTLSPESRHCTVECDSVVVQHNDFYWAARLEYFKQVCTVEVRGLYECRSFSSGSACRERVHTVLPLAPHHLVLLHGLDRGSSTVHMWPSVLHLRTLGCRESSFFQRHDSCCDGVRSIQLRLGSRHDRCAGCDDYDSVDGLWSLQAADLSCLVDLDVAVNTNEAEAFVVQLVSKAPDLEALTSRGNVTDLLVRAVAAYCPSLRRVDLSLNHISKGALTALVSRRPEVEELIARNGASPCSDDDDDEYTRTCNYDKLYAMLTGWRCLRRLTVSDIPVQNSTLAELGKNCPQLEYLYSDAHDPADPVSDVGVAALAQGCPRLRHLQLPVSEGAIGDAGVIAVAEHCTSLTHLDLSSTGVTDAGFVAVAKQCCLLEHLNLSCTEVTNIAVTAIATSLPLLRFLRLSETAVDSTGIVPLGEGCPQMEEFSASITDSSAIESVVPHWPCLKKLDLEDVVPTASLFAAFGRHNSNLECVTMRHSAGTQDLKARLPGGATLVMGSYLGRWVKSTRYVP